MTGTPSTRRRQGTDAPRRARSLAPAVAVPLAAALPLLAALPAAPAAAAEVPTLAPDALAAGWLSGQQQPDGGFGTPGATADTVLALVSAGQGRAQVEAALPALRAAVPAFGFDAEGTPVPAGLAKLVLALESTSTDATDVDGRDLVAALASTAETGGPDDGRLSDPVTDDVDSSGAFTQSLGLLALVAADATVPDASVTWLLDQQCTDGGWQFAARPAQDGGGRSACDSADTNSTAYAVQALHALDAGDEAVDRALSFLQGAQTSAGGFPFVPPAQGEGDADPTSTALSLAALRAAGQDPSAPRWTSAAGTTAEQALVAAQRGCAAPDGRGAYPGFSSDTDVAATSAALPALAGAPLPVPPRAVASLSADTPVAACGGLTPLDVAERACPPDAVGAQGSPDGTGDAPASLPLECLAAGGITSGAAGDGEPTAPLTRGEAVVLLSRAVDALGLDAAAADAGPAPFSDLGEEPAEVRAAAARLAALGVVRGTTASTLDPAPPLTRGQQASLLTRTVAAVAADDDDVTRLPAGVDAFADDDGSVHAPAVDALARARVATGRDDGTFTPGVAVSRGESAALLARTLQLVLEQRDETGPVSVPDDA